MNVNGLASILHGSNYPVVISKISKNKEFLLGLKNYFFHDLMECQLQFIKDLSGILKYDPKFIIPSIKFIPYSSCIIYSLESILQYLNEQYPEALKSFDEAEKNSLPTTGFNVFYERMLFHFLTLIQMFQQTKEGKHLEKALEIFEKFKKLSDQGQFFFAPRFQLMSVVYESVRENVDKANILNQFDQTLNSCSSSPLLSAVICELILNFCIHSFPLNVSQVYFDMAIKLWTHIGAYSKVSQLKKKYSNFSQTAKILTPDVTQLTSSITSTNSDGSNSLDMMTIIKASQALSGELTTSNLVKQVMMIIKENTGAETGALIVSQGSKDQLAVVATISILGEVKSQKTPLNESDSICNNLINISVISKKPLIINDVKKSEFSNDSYLKRNAIKSLCIYPIKKGNNLVGLIYLENKTLEGIFDDNRKQLLGHIGSQLTISYENATLYEDLNSLNHSYERFLPKEFLKQIGKGDVRNINKGDSSMKKMCVLFTDIRNFTTLTENMSPNESFSFINEILSYLSPVISNNNGFVDKFVGDCIMALFPHEIDDSVRCGLGLLSALEKYNLEVRQDKSKVKIGIGIHYGDVMLGTIGDETRIDATVISDAVNTASRIESFTKTLGANLLVSESLISNCKSTYKNRYIGKYLLKGKTQPMELFHITEFEDEQNNAFKTAMEFFENKKFNEAQEMFQKIGDQTSLYLENISSVYKQYVFTEKWSGEIQIDKDGNMERLENELLIQKNIESLSEESQMKILSDLIKNGKMKEFLSLMSKNSPNDVNESIYQHSK
jgi:class 3 adenylate cyclase/GAF domain-containing protein